MVSFSHRAWVAVGKTISGTGEQNVYLRFRAKSGAENAVRYRLYLEQIRKNDLHEMVINMDGWMLIMDDHTADLTQAASIDYINSRHGRGYLIKNPLLTDGWKTWLEKKIQKALDHRMPPSMRRHGGWMELVRVVGDTAYVRACGACQGCMHAIDGFNVGPAKIIIQAVEEIQRVVDLSEHEVDPFHEIGLVEAGGALSG